MTLILSGSDGLSDVDGSASTPAIRGTDSNTGIFFPAADTIAFAEGGTEVARFDSSGNLGIGTSSPSYRLHLSGASSVVNYVQTTSSGSGNTASNRWRAATYEWGVYVPDNVNTMVFYDYGQSLERMRIDSSGNLLVGMTSVVDAGRMNLSFDNSVQRGIVTTSNQTAASDHLLFRNPNGQVGNIRTTNSTTAYNTSSDYRLKEDVQPMAGALAKVAALKPCTYKWKVDGSEGEGFIAHELAEVCPGAVSGEKDAVNEDGSIKPQGIDTSFLVATLTAAIQELTAKLDVAEARIAALEGAK